MSVVSTIDIKSVATRTITREAEAVASLLPMVNADFERAVQAIVETKGRLVVSGIGKSAIIAQKIVATLNSTGTPAIFLHAADAIHGDLGMIQQEDVVLIISKSGESPEIKVLVPLIRNFGNTLIAMVGNIEAYLARQADIILNTTVSQEACPNNLAPTSSTTAQLVMGDALAVVLMELKGFGSDDFARFHPGGTLGKKLYLHVSDLYVNNECPKVLSTASLKQVIVEISKKRLGATAVVDTNDQLLGVITDGDLRRMLEKSITLQLDEIKAAEIMTKHPKTIHADALAVEALDLLRQYDITQLVVTTGSTYLGFIHLHDLVREGLI
ncbi:KpsF/GutQ family sugar-phosphate isomerase [Paraflavitalea soli]|uniref:KpsF/GutQ family sugar-phosphate isomerase n=1 Tax=Paraflavitalea soli TaxID=2315862 RepID=A0A3B7MU81_9BACT|nr:KpsF/GutQ family sugar-phosphate isomerase [Paraflavitalea soli]AXY76640.1 KpsF/GutQ family sugar-phosphate isomerase [Paraflavitalea soli]